MNKKPKIPFLIFEVKDHYLIKEKILDSIQEMGTYSFINKEQSISNSDWHLGSDFNRSYAQYIEKVVLDVVDFVNKKFNYEEKLTARNYWFQQYEYGNWHSWHIHKHSLFSCSYFIDLSSDNPKTSFELFGEEFEVDVKEGMVLIFPSFLKHCSKPNKSKHKKTILAFNMS